MQAGAEQQEQQAGAEQQEQQAEEAVLVLDSSQEDLGPDLRGQDVALKEAFANLEKAKEEYRKAAALDAQGSLRKGLLPDSLFLRSLTGWLQPKKRSQKRESGSRPL